MVTKMQESGFCFGVRGAVEKAMQYEPGQKNMVLFGNLVNNENVVQSLKKKGFSVAEDTAQIPKHSIVIIRAHGVSRAVYEELEEKHAQIEDCTCVRVKRVHEIVRQKSREHYKILIVGKKSHPEVIGTLGWCSPGQAFVIEKVSDLDGLDLTGKVCVVAQTTCSRKLWEEVTGRLLEINGSADAFDTLCKVMRNREERAKEIARSSDVMIVIGDRTSSNSRELYQQCRSVCENTWFIHSRADLEKDADIKDAILHSEKIGLAGSASAPDEIIDDVYHYLMFLDFMKTAKSEIKEGIRQYFDEFCEEIIENPFVRDSLRALMEQNERGKRIRGAMIKLGEQIASHGGSRHYLPIAVGYELFQTSVLIHDDVIDRSDTRRGKTTIHVDSAHKIKDRLGEGITDENARHYGVSRALCTGDYGFFISYQFLAKCDADSSVMAKVYRLYSKILTMTCEGEIMDTVLPFDKVSISEHYEEYKKVVSQIYEYKTAWYTLAGPLMLGAVCGGGDDELLSVLKEIMIPLGIAFQIKDDLLGIYSDEKTLGKSVLSDIGEDKQTLLLGYAYKNATQEQRDLLDRHYGKKHADAHDLEMVRKLFEDTGAKQEAEDEICRLSEQSKQLIQNDRIDREYQAILFGLVSYLTDRKF